MGRDKIYQRNNCQSLSLIDLPSDLEKFEIREFVIFNRIMKYDKDTKDNITPNSLYSKICNSIRYAILTLLVIMFCDLMYFEIRFLSFQMKLLRILHKQVQSAEQTFSCCFMFAFAVIVSTQEE